MSARSGTGTFPPEAVAVLQAGDIPARHEAAATGRGRLGAPLPLAAFRSAEVAGSAQPGCLQLLAQRAWSSPLPLVPARHQYRAVWANDTS